MTKRRKGIILAGGSGTRLYPITLAVSKQLTPLYDKPMIYYPLSVLMLAGVREIAIITTPQDRPAFERLLGDGGRWGLAFSYLEQPKPDGLAQAYPLAEEFLDGAASAMILGDNIFYGDGLPRRLRAAGAKTQGAVGFGYRVTEPQRYGVVSFDAKGDVEAIDEKPERPRSDYALTGLYFLDSTAPERARRLRPSPRGELEITDLLDQYRREGALSVELLGRGYAWLDAGTHDSLIDAGLFVRTIEQRQGLKIGCPEEIAFRMGLIDREALLEACRPLANTQYGQYLLRIAHDGADE